MNLPAFDRLTSKRKLVVFGSLVLLIIAIASSLYTYNNKQYDSDTRSDAGVLGTTVSLGELNGELGASIKTSGENSLYKYNKPYPGVYTVQATKFACAIGPASCEPDRFEITYSKKINHIFGIGRQTDGGQAELTMQKKSDGTEEFLDTNFSTGHMVDADGTSRYTNDPPRMKTPVLVLPEEKVLFAYIQPYVKMMRVSRSPNKTSIILKKHNLYNEGAPGTLVVIKGSSVPDMYNKYYGYLKSYGFFFKKPIRQAYGVNWETLGEFSTAAPIVGGATAYGLKDTLNRYATAGIKLNTMTFGSGYWQQTFASTNVHDYGGIYQQPSIDVLKVKEQALKTLFADLSKQGVYPMIGMRQHASTATGNGLTVTGVQNVTQKLQALGVTNPFINGDFYYGGRSWLPKVKMLNLENPAVSKAYLKAINDAYGPVKGFKEDEMIVNDVKGELKNNNAVNMKDGFVSKIYKAFSDYYGGDVVSIGSNDWFGVGTDAQVFGATGYYSPSSNDIFTSTKVPGMYAIKDSLDAAISQVASGYPHPMVFYYPEADFAETNGPISCTDANKNAGDDAKRIADYDTYCKIPDKSVQLYLRGNQINTFVPFYMTSRGFWHLTKPSDQQNYIYFAKLRNRLQQYTYDNALAWYADGVSHLMRPLFFDSPADAEVYKLYQSTGDIKTDPKDEYMFGDALLIRPIYFDNVTSVKTYFPAGADYIPFIKANGETIKGGQYYTYPLGVSLDYPAFLKEGAILAIDDADTANKRLAYFFLNSKTQTGIYTLNNANGTKTRLQGFKRDGLTYLKNLDNGKEVQTTKHPQKSFQQVDIAAVL